MEIQFCDEFYTAGYLVKVFHVGYHSSYLVTYYALKFSSACLHQDLKRHAVFKST